MIIDWKTGYEIELLAPKGASRLDLAQSYAAQSDGGRVVPVFVPQAEFSRVEGTPIFENLTLAYDAMKSDGEIIARCADDLTILADLDSSAPPKNGWFRIVGDEPRLLRLTMRHADPSSPLSELLEPLAEIFGTELEHFDNEMVRLHDTSGAAIAMAAPLPGERERPCEIITPPISTNHRDRLSELLEPAQRLGFTIPQEAALHMHFDATPLCNASAFSNLVLIFHRHGDALKRLFRTNPNCVRLGKWPDELVGLTSDPAFSNLTWDEVIARCSDLHITKFVDFNILNVLAGQSDKHTFEVRIFPVTFDVELILKQTVLIEGMLKIATDTSVERSWLLQASLRQMIEAMEITPEPKRYWLQEISTR